MYLKIDMTSQLHSWLKQVNKKQKDKIGKIIKEYKQQFKERKDSVRFVRKILDNWIKHVKKQTKVKISCDKGCYFCCMVEVIVGELEVENISRYIKRYDIKPIFDQKDNRCPFLNSENLCNIYPVRPAVCRKYFVTGDKNLCNILTNKGLVKIVSDVSIEMLVTGLWQVGKVSEIRKAFRNNK